MTRETREATPSGEGYVEADDGARLFVERRGSGAPTVVVLNGFYLREDFDRLAAGRAVLFCDLRNRGRSQFLTDAAKLERGVLQDVDDLESVRRHFEMERMALVGHSYAGIVPILYAMKFPTRVERAVQIGPMQPQFGRQYPAHLTYTDATLQEVSAKLALLQNERASFSPEQFCRKFWSELRILYVVDAADAPKIRWERCDLPTELNLMKYWLGSLLPSIRKLDLAAEDLSKVTSPVLTIHGVKDRSAPYGGGREWALLLPNARLLAVEEAGHAPWIERPDTVFLALSTFLDGKWPEPAREVRALDPSGELPDR